MGSVAFGGLLVTGVRTGMLVSMVAVFLAATAFGEPELKWYASRSAVVCTDVPEQGVRLRVKGADGRVAFEESVEGPRANRDWVTGGAWFDETGALHPSYGLWALREHARRQIVTMLEAGVKEPWLTIHHTNANILPIVSFATNLMGMEDKYGTTDFQDRWARDYIRTVNQGYQAGVQASPDVAISTYRRGERLLLVIGSFAKSVAELPLQLRTGRIVRAVDLETDKALVCEQGVDP